MDTNFPHKKSGLGRFFVAHPFPLFQFYFEGETRRLGESEEANTVSPMKWD